MTNETDLRECCAQIELVEQLIEIPEEHKELLVKLQTKKKLLIIFKPRSYHDILRDLDSGAISHPGVWTKPPKRVKEPEKIEPPKKKKEPKKEIPKVKEIEKAEIDQAAEIKRLKAELKKAQETKAKEVKEEIIGE